MDCGIAIEIERIEGQCVVGRLEVYILSVYEVHALRCGSQ